jgi:hypothetical protein
LGKAERGRVWEPFQGSHYNWGVETPARDLNRDQLEIAQIEIARLLADVKPQNYTRPWVARGVQGVAPS